MRKTLEKLLPKKNLDLHDDFSELLEDLRVFGITIVNELEVIIKNHWDKVKETEAMELLIKEEELGEGEPIRGTSEARIRKGVFFTHVGLTRCALQGNLDQILENIWNMEEKLPMISKSFWKKVDSSRYFSHCNKSN